MWRREWFLDHNPMAILRQVRNAVQFIRAPSSTRSRMRPAYHPIVPKGLKTAVFKRPPRRSEHLVETTLTLHFSVTLIIQTRVAGEIGNPVTRR
ncbi:hypothetical protein BDZ94DRAFT_1260525 [Collybia nuda]|uniref:Uncharacterized protein n=1 Tax=Collybia nuda TaxID=64659 RepID=A0A9P5Y5N1_9AGAR|nr:hypothetical protein BDZ94DRAFT_1260525 [Collybia nuda]